MAAPSKYTKFKPSDLVANLMSLRGNPGGDGLSPLLDLSKLQPFKAHVPYGTIQNLPPVYGQSGSGSGAAPFNPAQIWSGGKADVERAMKTIRTRESSGRYNAMNPKSSASGAYQFIDSTWRNLGGSTARAYQASPQEQDAIARKYVTQILGANGNDLRALAGTWFLGGPGYAANKNNLNYVPPRNTISLGAYINGWLKAYG